MYARRVSTYNRRRRITPRRAVRSARVPYRRRAVAVRTRRPRRRIIRRR